MRSPLGPPKAVLGRGSGVAMILGLVLSGCATLPSSGPTGSEIRKGADLGTRAPTFSYTLVEVKDGSQVPPPEVTMTSNLTPGVQQPTDLLGPGDVLNIAIYEAGVALFGNSGLRTGTSGSVSLDPTSSVAQLPTMRVDDSGYVRVPFVGRVRAAGRTAAELQTAIQSALRGMSQSPQVVVSIADSITNSIIVSGEVVRPGRLVLSTNQESFADVIALAGGYRGAAKDAVARLERNGAKMELRLSDLLDDSFEEVRVSPGDRITLISRPQSISVLGASNRADEIVFPRPRLSLAQAVALAGGVNPNQGDAAGIFVFRHIRLADGTEQPTVYHLNMGQAGAYLLSQRFAMRDRDVLFVANARANQVSKFVQLLSQLFIPVTTVRAVAQ